jgi:threonine aldolase
MVFVDTRAIGVAPLDMMARLRAGGVLSNVVSGRLRLLTHRDVTAEDVEEAITLWGGVVSD